MRARAALSLLRHSGRSATRADPESRSGVGNRFRGIPGSRVSRAPWNDGGSRIDVHEIPQQRVDFVVPALAAEYAVMADAGLHVMYLAIGAHAGAKVLRRQRLTDRADVVLFALHRHQAHSLDRGRVHRSAAIGQLALRQQMLLKHVADGFDIE